MKKMPDNMEYKTIPFDFKADDAAGRFSGFGAVYGNVDLGDDVIEHGAFTKSLGKIAEKGNRVPILWQHYWDEPIGHWENLREGEKGLRGDGVLLTDTDPLALRAYGLIKASSISGLSIGYRVNDYKMDQLDGKTVRRLKELDLREISVVTFPMNEEARIDAVKAAEMTERDLERLLTRDAGLSRTVAQKLMSGGYQAIAKRDAGENETGLNGDLAATLRKALEVLRN